jgi:glucose/arabinose dehydrogenase
VARLNSAAQGGTASTFATVTGSPVDLRFGTDGALYVLTRGGITRIARMP